MYVYLFYQARSYIKREIFKKYEGNTKDYLWKNEGFLLQPQLELFSFVVLIVSTFKGISEMFLSKSFCLSRTNVSRALVGGAKFQPNQFSPINQIVRSAGTQIKVVLLDDVANFGKRGDVIDVTTGYARNFLIPKKVAGKQPHHCYY